MPYLTIRDSNTEFFYQDSGAPRDLQVYTTLVVVHGFCFHSAVFQHVVRLAPSTGIRMVCLNRRDYPGTTMYTPTELKDLCEGDADAHSSFIKACGIEIAEFLDGIIDVLSLPRPTPDGKDGGLALMGWSMGNVFTLSAASAVGSLQPHVRDRLGSYLRRLIMFDSPCSAVGIPGVASALTFDKTIPQEDLRAQIVRSVTSYFSHGDLTSRNIENLNFTVPDTHKHSVAASLSPHELDSLTDFEPAFRSDTFFFRFQDRLYDQMRKVLFGLEIRAHWPKMDVWLLYCDSSAGTIVNAAWEIEKLAKVNEDLPVRILTVKDAHHLVFWDNPEKAMEAFEHCLRH